MINTVDIRTSTDQILMLERGALDRWGKGDPGGFLELYAADITYFDPLTAARIDGHQAMESPPWRHMEGDSLALVVHPPPCVSEHDAGGVRGAGGVTTIV
jgi:hypothetical protein